MNSQYLIFTDMDGTLLDHHTYSHEPAKNTLKTLKRLQIPVIPNTSKTFDEMLVLREQIGLTGPFIVENGAAIFIPHAFFKHKPANTQWINEHWLHQFTSKRSHWLNLLNRLEHDFSGLFTHFANMDINEICEATGLSPEQAQRAANRHYGEPVLWLGDERQKQLFIQAVRAMGASPLIGGRFIHISGECNKGIAMRWLCNEYRRQHPDKLCTSIALGDGNNDTAMLDAADVAVRIKSPTHDFPRLNRTQNTLDSISEGPKGWSETVTHILNLTS
ncbi:HAD-IIB family hydrolase [Aliiglaciecola litoralis]|uniref:Mannosyl-3-phosphoglycerate phosphatase-related protein n=1 Tax=Aliiglaciecola litoralis TaxID=582857 RepID=A0ABP3WQ01_9ALTE